MNLDKELLSQLAKGEIEEVVGVVDPRGAFGAGYPKEDLWILSFTFAVWKYANGPIQDGTLTLRKSSNRGEFDSFRTKVPPFGVIRVRARFAPQTIFPKPQGLLVEIIGKESSDEELNRLALKLQEPVTFEDSRFGTFTFDLRIEWYEAKTSWLSSTILLHLKGDEVEHVMLALKQAYLLWDSKELWGERIADYAAAELLDLYNGNWRPEEEPELSAEQFKSMIKLESISVNETGRFEFWYEDGNLFASHAILIQGDLLKGPNHAGIEG